MWEYWQRVFPLLKGPFGNWGLKKVKERGYPRERFHSVWVLALWKKSLLFKEEALIQFFHAYLPGRKGLKTGGVWAGPKVSWSALQ